MILFLENKGGTGKETETKTETKIKTKIGTVVLPIKDNSTDFEIRSRHRRNSVSLSPRRQQRRQSPLAINGRSKHVTIDSDNSNRRRRMIMKSPNESSLSSSGIRSRGGRSMSPTNISKKEKKKKQFSQNNDIRTASAHSSDVLLSASMVQLPFFEDCNRAGNSLHVSTHHRLNVNNNGNGNDTDTNTDNYHINLKQTNRINKLNPPKDDTPIQNKRSNTKRSTCTSKVNRPATNTKTLIGTMASSSFDVNNNSNHRSLRCSNNVSNRRLLGMTTSPGFISSPGLSPRISARRQQRTRSGQNNQEYGNERKVDQDTLEQDTNHLCKSSNSSSNSSTSIYSSTNNSSDSGKTNTNTKHTIEKQTHSRRSRSSRSPSKGRKKVLTRGPLNSKTKTSNNTSTSTNMSTNRKEVLEESTTSLQKSTLGLKEKIKKKKHSELDTSKNKKSNTHTNTNTRSQSRSRSKSKCARRGRRYTKNNVAAKSESPDIMIAEDNKQDERHEQRRRNKLQSRSKSREISNRRHTQLRNPYQHNGLLSKNNTASTRALGSPVNAKSKTNECLTSLYSTLWKNKKEDAERRTTDGTHNPDVNPADVVESSILLTHALTLDEIEKMISASPFQ